MKKFAVVLTLLSLSATLSWADTEREDAIERLQKAGKVVQEIMATPDKGIPQEVLEGTKCVAVVPNMIKAGFIFGGKRGQGVATCRTASGWSAPTFFDITGGSWGAQIGVQGVDLVMMIMNEKGMKRLLGNKFQIGGEVSAAAGPVGRHASAGTDWKLDTEILTYSRAKGAFAGATIEGSWVDPNHHAITALYGKDVPSGDLLTGKVPSPPEAQPFIASVRQARQVAVE